MYRVLKNEHFTTSCGSLHITLLFWYRRLPQYMKLVILKWVQAAGCFTAECSPLYAALLTVIFVFYPHMYGRGNGSESWPVTLGSSDGVKQVEAKSYDFDIYL